MNKVVCVDFLTGHAKDGFSREYGARDCSGITTFMFCREGNGRKVPASVLVRKV
jgi:hypothetical protein